MTSNVVVDATEVIEVPALTRQVGLALDSGNAVLRKKVCGGDRDRVMGDGVYEHFSLSDRDG